MGDVRVSTVLFVRNPLKKSVLYKVKTSDNCMFRIDNPTGFIESGESVTVKVIVCEAVQ